MVLLLLFDIERLYSVNAVVVFHRLLTCFFPFKELETFQFFPYDRFIVKLSTLQ